MMKALGTTLGIEQQAVALWRAANFYLPKAPYGAAALLAITTVGLLGRGKRQNPSAPITSVCVLNCTGVVLWVAGAKGLTACKQLYTGFQLRDLAQIQFSACRASFALSVGSLAIRYGVGWAIQLLRSTAYSQEVRRALSDLCGLKFSIALGLKRSNF
jgi:hypothetical protein